MQACGLYLGIAIDQDRVELTFSSVLHWGYYSDPAALLVTPYPGY
jgi:hypothetical protein